MRISVLNENIALYMHNLCVRLQNGWMRKNSASICINVYYKMLTSACASRRRDIIRKQWLVSFVAAKNNTRLKNFFFFVFIISILSSLARAVQSQSLFHAFTFRARDCFFSATAAAIVGGKNRLASPRCHRGSGPAFVYFWFYIKKNHLMMIVIIIIVINRKKERHMRCTTTREKTGTIQHNEMWQIKKLTA